jgi:S-adenosyl methyltransferase
MSRLGPQMNEGELPQSREARASAAMAQVFDPTVPNVARIYDFLLGGKDNFPADREAARRLVKAVPGAVRAARDNRAFMQRAVRFLATEAGIRQFVDIGTGLPTRGNVHEIAHAASPDTRVVYVDNDPVVLTHAHALLAKPVTVGAVECDLRYPGHLLTMPEVRALIDFDKPFALLMVAVLHFMEDSEDPWATLNYYKSKMPPGSYLVISHVTGDNLARDAIDQASDIYKQASAPGVARALGDIERFFSGLEMVAPGLVNVTAWRPQFPDRKHRPALFYAGIGRKPGEPA